MTFICTSRRALSLLAAAGTALCSAATPSVANDKPLVPSFVEETTTAGIGSVYQGEWQYMVGGGAASFDCNADGFPDLFLAGGEANAGFYRNASTSGGTLRFEKHTSGLELANVTGAYPLDIDNDGLVDVALLRVGENVVMRGLGGCRFERANEAFDFDGGDAWSTAFAATFEKGAAWPTLAIGNYVNRAEELFPWGSCTENWLHRPARDGKPGFEAPLPLKPSFCALSMLFSDWNRSGKPSLRVSNDREYYKGGQEQLWRIEPGQEPMLFGQADGWKEVRIWGMGIAANDINDDGYPEYFLTSMADNRLQVLENPEPAGTRPTYREAAWPTGVTAQRPHVGGDVRPSTAWHAQFDDVNNDGRADLFIAKGNVAKMPDFAQEDPNNLLLQKSDGTFVEAAAQAGVASTAISRGGLVVDFNLDGHLDLVVVNRWTTAQIWRNTSPSLGNWLQIALRQAGPNRDGIGAWIEVDLGERTIRREVTVGGGHVSGHLGWVHLGVGSATEADIRVIWPDGKAETWSSISANGFVTLERDSPAKPWKPQR